MESVPSPPASSSSSRTVLYSSHLSRFTGIAGIIWQTSPRHSGFSFRLRKIDERSPSAITVQVMNALTLVVGPAIPNTAPSIKRSRFSHCAGLRATSSSWGSSSKIQSGRVIAPFGVVYTAPRISPLVIPAAWKTACEDIDFGTCGRMIRFVDHVM